MRYIIAGKRESVDKYLKKYPLEDGEEIKYCSRSNHLDNIGLNDVLILLPGWFSKSWAKNDVQKIIEIGLFIEYHDGKIGESERKNLKSDSINSRFDLLDL